MSQYINKSHNVTALLYHLVFPAKYRRVVFDDDVEKVLKEVCLGIEERYEIKFLEIGTDRDHVHFLVQSVPRYSVTKIVTMLKSITAKEIFKRCPQVKKKLWGGEFWTDGYFASTETRQRLASEELAEFKVTQCVRRLIAQNMGNLRLQG